MEDGNHGLFPVTRERMFHHSPLLTSSSVLKTVKWFLNAANCLPGLWLDIRLFVHIFWFAKKQFLKHCVHCHIDTFWLSQMAWIFNLLLWCNIEKCLEASCIITEQSNCTNSAVPISWFCYLIIFFLAFKQMKPAPQNYIPSTTSEILFL